MATEYHKLREPITGLSLNQGERKSHLRFFIGGVDAGELTFCNEDASDFLKLLADTTATAVMVTGVGVMVRMKIDEPGLPNLISEWGDLRSLNQIKADWSNQIEMYRSKHNEAEPQDRQSSTAISSDAADGEAVVESPA